MTQKPLLIAVEGCDGTGKTTLVAALVQAFLSLGIPATSIKRPAKDALAAFYVQGQTITDAQVLAMMNVDCKNALEQARTLQANGVPIVILDRHYISAAIYQGGDDWQGEFERQRDRWLEPDLWVFCHAKWQDVQRRIAQRDADNDKHTPIETIAARLAQYEWTASKVTAPVINYRFGGDTVDIPKSFIMTSAKVDGVSGRYFWGNGSPASMAAEVIAKAVGNMK